MIISPITPLMFLIIVLTRAKNKKGDYGKTGVATMGLAGRESRHSTNDPAT